VPRPCLVQQILQYVEPTLHFNPLQAARGSLCTVIDPTLTDSAITEPD